MRKVNKKIIWIIFIFLILTKNILIADNKVKVKFIKEGKTKTDIGIDLFLQFKQEQCIKNNNIKFNIIITNKNNYTVKLFNPIYLLMISIFNEKGKRVNYKDIHPSFINSISPQKRYPFDKEYKGFRLIKVEYNQTLVKKENYFIGPDLEISPNGKYIYTIKLLKFRDTKKYIATESDIAPGNYKIHVMSALSHHYEKNNSKPHYKVNTPYKDFIIK